MVRIAYWMCKRRFGKVPVPIGIMAHNQRVLAAVAGYEMAIEKASALPPRLKELAQIRAAMMIGCRFCIDIGASIASKNGLSEAELLGLIDHKHCAHFSDLDKRVLDYAEAMCGCPMVIPDELFRSLLADLGEPGMVELTAMIAWENHRARFNHAFGAKEEGYSEKSVCLLPARTETAHPVTAHAG